MRLALLLTAVFVVAGCGGGDGQLSAEEYQEQGNAICTKYEGEIDAVPAPSGDDPQQLTAYLDKTIPLAEQQIADLRALEPPEDDQKTHDKMLAEADGLLGSARDLRTAVVAGDENGVNDAIAEADASNKQADELATDLGLDSCVTDE